MIVRLFVFLVVFTLSNTSLVCAQRGPSTEVLSSFHTPQESRVDSLLPALPEADENARLWTRWWWMGSAVTEEGISAHLEAFRNAGLGGVEIIPIYGVKGHEARFLPYLGEQWLHMLGHTLREGERLGMKVDMTLGTGWPYGGPWITERHAAKRWDPASGQMVSTGQRVKRSAPGAEGLVMDPFDEEALAAFLKPYEEAFQHGTIPTASLRAFFNDSYEVYGANWTDHFLDAFRDRRGYDLQPYLKLVFDSTATDEAVRVRSDYYETLSGLLLEAFILPWVVWCHSKGTLARNQAHGSPGNLLDLYAAADIPETESFGPSKLDIPGVRLDPDFSEEQFGRPSPLVMKFASSAAHVMGKTLVSSETATWLGEHFKVALSQVKPQVDELYVSGINHVLLHGIAYSPFDEPYPGWLFYASTHFGPSSQLWDDLPELAAYVRRVQVQLQNSLPDSDLLLYFPIHEIWRRPGTSSSLHMIGVHNPEEWLFDTPFGELAALLRSRGYVFDYVSDRQMQQFEIDGNGFIRTPGHTYKAIVVPPVHSIPLETLQALQQLAEQGARVSFMDAFPIDVPGLNQAAARKIQVDALKEEMQRQISAQNQSVSIVSEGNIYQMLQTAGIRRETLVDNGLQFTRKRFEEGTLYFIANLDRQFQEGWVNLNTPATSVEIMDPLTGQRGISQSATSMDHQTSVYLQLAPGQSVLVRAYDQKIMGPDWLYVVPAGEAIPVAGEWQIDFVKGGPSLPEPARTDQLVSWTELDSPGVRDFSGRARYRIQFTVPDSLVGKPAKLDLGTVRESARVRLNGQEIGNAWSVPFTLNIPAALLEKQNDLEVEVANLAANRIAALDRSGVEWKRYYEINFVNIQYQPFDASEWDPEPSGLLGPVRIYPAEAVTHPPD